MVFKVDMKRSEHRTGHMIARDIIYWILTTCLTLFPALYMHSHVNLINH